LYVTVMYISVEVCQFFFHMPVEFPLPRGVTQCNLVEISISEKSFCFSFWVQESAKIIWVQF